MFKMENLDELSRQALLCEQEMEALITRIAGVTISELAESLQNDYDLLLLKKATIESKIAADVGDYISHDIENNDVAEEKNTSVCAVDNLFDALIPLLTAEIVKEITNKIHKMRIKIPSDMSQRRCIAQFASAFGLQLRLGDDVINAHGEHICEVPLLKCGDVMRFAKKNTAV